MKPAATIRANLEDFVVDELPAYAPVGHGPHVFLRVRKTGLTTFECIARIARATGTAPREIGHAGMKDRHAITSQYLSLPWPEPKDLAPLRELVLPDVEILEVSRHTNKLRTGHLAGNRFRIVLRDIDPAALDQVQRDLSSASARGFPNSFGPQRFGRDGDNPQRTLAWLRGETRGPRDPRMARLLFSSLQAWLFDRVLQARLEDDTWATVLAGDVVKKHDTGGLFDCTDPDTDARRAADALVSATGPIFGAEMRRASGLPGQLEDALLHDAIGDPSTLERHRKLGAGSRRVLRVFPSEMALTSRPDGSLLAEFTLPKGVYATTLLGGACTLTDARAPRAGANPAEETSGHDELLYDPQPTSG